MALSFTAIGITSKNARIILHGKLIPNNVKLVRHMISLPIQWKRPTKPSFWDPFYTGDGVTKLEVDWNKSPKLVQESKELETADGVVKTLFTFRYMGRWHAMKYAKEEMVDSVKNHNYDETSLEVLVAKRTAVIRNMMDHNEQYMALNRHRKPDKQAVPVVNTMLGKRHRLLQKLRMWDYKKYEWILEKLDLYHSALPEAHQNIKRKPSIRKLTDAYCTQFKERKLDAYKEELEGRRAEFFTRKIEKLQWMRQVEIECGAERTVSEDDIRQAEDQLKQHMKTVKTESTVLNTSRNVLDNV